MLVGPGGIWATHDLIEVRGFISFIFYFQRVLKERKYNTKCLYFKQCKRM